MSTKWVFYTSMTKIHWCIKGFFIHQWLNYIKIMILFNLGVIYPSSSLLKGCQIFFIVVVGDFERRALCAKVSKSSSEVDQFSVTKATRLQVPKDISQLLIWFNVKKRTPIEICVYFLYMVKILEITIAWFRNFTWFYLSIFLG